MTRLQFTGSGKQYTPVLKWTIICTEPYEQLLSSFHYNWSVYCNNAYRLQSMLKEGFYNFKVTTFKTILHADSVNSPTIPFFTYYETVHVCTQGRFYRMKGLGWFPHPIFYMQPHLAVKTLVSWFWRVKKSRSPFFFSLLKHVLRECKDAIIPSKDIFIWWCPYLVMISFER